jgi:hypothetical protein
MSLADVTGFVWEAELTSKVYSDYSSNPWGGYTFEYILANVSDSSYPANAEVSSLTIGFEPTDMLDVGYLSSGGEAPAGVFMLPSGDGLTWIWPPGLESGDFSATLVVHSQYKEYEKGAAAVGGNSSLQVFEAWVPSVGATVPETSSCASLLALGLAGLALIRRKF